jgi:hypothetical protein
VEGEAVKAVFADVEGQSADDDPKERKWDRAGNETRSKGREPECEPDVGAMSQEREDHPTTSPY